MDIEQSTRSQTGNESLLDTGRPHIHEVVKFIRGELLQPLQPIVSAKARPAQSVATFGTKTVNNTIKPGVGRPARIAIKAKGKILFIDAGDVVAVEAKGNYVLILHRSGSHRLRESLSTVEERLSLHGFVRIHRSVLVNAALVEEIQPWPTGEYALRVQGGKEYTVTRSYKKNLQLLAQLWIGTCGFDAE